VGTPTISRTDPIKGEAITASPATISDADGLVGVTYQFQWQQSAAGGGTTFTNIAGATGVSFTPAQQQVNRQLRVAVSFVDNHGTGERVLSAPTIVVGNVIVGTAGSNVLSGTAGRDNIDGLDGADLILAGAGNDIITGGAGTDSMTGGAGNDVFRFGLGSGTDTITDFDADPTGGQDLLDISARGITAATFATKVSITGTLISTVITFVGTTDSIRLVGVPVTAVTIADFILAR
jgi:Ca2+-binding RTX toxin-like protein